MSSPSRSNSGLGKGESSPEGSRFSHKPSKEKQTSRDFEHPIHTTKRNDSPKADHSHKKALPPIVLGYWRFKGLAEPLRWLLGYMQVNYQEWNPSSSQDWFKEKILEYKGDFPNLPYIQNDDFIMSQSSAIPIYLCNYFGKSHLLGKTYLDQARVREIEGVLLDIRDKFYKAIWSESPEENIKLLLNADNSNNKRFDYLSKSLGKSDYFLGYLTWADLQFAYLCEFLDSLTISFGETCPSCKHENLSALAGRVRELDGIKQRVQQSGDTEYFPPEFLSFKFFTFNQMSKKYQQMEASKGQV